MDFTNVINYQKADGARKKIHDEIRKHPDYAKAKEHEERFKSARQHAAKCEAFSAKIMAEYNGAETLLEKKSKEAEELCEKLSATALSEEEEKNLCSALEECKTVLAELDAKLKSLKADAEKVLSEYKKAQMVGKDAKAKYDEHYASYNKYKQENGAKLEEATKESDALRAKVETELLELYDRLIAINVRPPFVANMGDDKKPVCICGMGQSQTTNAEFVANGYVSCENCHRIIYKK